MVLAQNQKITISSKAENLRQVEQMIEDVCDLYKIGEDNYGNILIALTEAVNNAIYHGNKADPNKNVDISYRTTVDTISFTIKDQGQGFKYENLPDPTSPENIENPNGRGVFLMKNLADNVAFEDNGSKITLDFKLHNAA